MVIDDAVDEEKVEIDWIRHNPIFIRTDILTFQSQTCELEFLQKFSKFVEPNENYKINGTFNVIEISMGKSFTNWLCFVVAVCHCHRLTIPIIFESTMNILIVYVKLIHLYNINLSKWVSLTLVEVVLLWSLFLVVSSSSSCDFISSLSKIEKKTRRKVLIAMNTNIGCSVGMDRFFVLCFVGIRVAWSGFHRMFSV